MKKTPCIKRVKRQSKVDPFVFKGGMNRIYTYILSGQIKIFHQPRFSLKSGDVPSLATFWGVFGRVRSL